MLRINLLPAYVAQRRQTRMWKVVFTLAFIAIVAGMLVWNTILTSEVANETAMANQAVAAHQQIDTLNGQATSTLAQVGPILGKVKFYQDVMKSNVEAPDLYSRIARWTSPAIYYTDMSVNDNMLDIKGFTKSIADLNRYLWYMYTEPDVVNVGLVSALPTFNQAMIPVTLYRGQPINVGGQQAGQGLPIGLGGPPNGFGGPPNFGRGGPGGAAPNQAMLTDPGLANAMATGAGTTTGWKRADSFSFEVQCTLKTPITAPGDPASAAGGAGGGGAAATPTPMPTMGGA